MSRRVLCQKLGGAPFSFLLDDFGNSAYGFSLRKLRSAYAGDCIQVIRTSDSASLDIGFVNNVLDTASLLSFIGASDGVVTVWYNQGTGDNITQANTARRPHIVESGVLATDNGMPAIKFGVGGVVKNLDVVIQVYNQPNTFFSVVKRNADSGRQDFFELQEVGIDGNLTYTLDKDTLRIFAGTVLGGAFTTTSQTLVTSLFNTTSSQVRANNGLIASGNAGNRNGVQSFQIGRGFASSTNFLKGTIQEIVMYNSDRSADFNAIETQINNFYGIY